MDKELAEGAIGSVGKYEVELKGGKFIARVDASPAAGVTAGLTIELDASVLIDKIAEAIPGKVDDAIFAIVKSALLQG